MKCMPNRKRQLSPADRDFFGDVADIVFTNPFSDRRAELDVRVGGGGEKADHHHARVIRVIRRVNDRLRRLDEPGFATLDRYAGRDRDVLRYTFLFDQYHRCMSSFDQLIVDQVAAGDASCPVPFAKDALDGLEKRGFARDEALRIFGLYYQLRRAFFWIDQLVGESRCMRELRLNLWNNIFTSDIGWYDRYLWNRMEDFSTLFLGETGTGKGSAAAAIGRSGFIPFEESKTRFRESFVKSFVSLNLSQFPEALIESELFGHKKGAFTGAVEDHPGVFATCSECGSILLDEIGEAGGPIQIKLLRILQEREFTPVGSHETHRFRGRVIAATNRTLEDLRGGGTFRDDFYYRLCSDVITLPPLRRRIAEDPGELERLVTRTLERTLGASAAELLDFVVATIERSVGSQYPWPGNVRELEQCVRRILLKRDYEGDGSGMTGDRRAALHRRIDAAGIDAAELIETYCSLLYTQHGSYEQVARITGLDRRTVKKYILRGESDEQESSSKTRADS